MLASGNDVLLRQRVCEQGQIPQEKLIVLVIFNLHHCKSLMARCNCQFNGVLPLSLRWWACKFPPSRNSQQPFRDRATHGPQALVSPDLALGLCFLQGNGAKPCPPCNHLEAVLDKAWKFQHRRVEALSRKGPEL